MANVIANEKDGFSASRLDPILDAYLLKAGSDTSRFEFMEKGLGAGATIALNLGMRHLIDSVEDYYFRWDASRYRSRLEFNLLRARQQIDVYRVFELG